MEQDDFQELVRINAHRAKTIKLYWVAAILFWSGFLISLPYFYSQIGTIPSIWAGVLMVSGSVLYLVLHYLIKVEH